MNQTHKSTIEAKYKLLYPIRNQTESKAISLDNLIPEDHRVRAVWEFVDQLNMDVCYKDIATLEHVAGRSTTSPKVLLCLWIYSMIDGNISARKLEELCEYHSVYKWIVGGVPINRTMLAEFRSKSPGKFEELLIESLVAMVKAGILTDKDFSQDGTRVKANAGMDSFRRETTLLKLHEEVEQYIKTLELELQKNPQQYEMKKINRTQKQAQKRSETIKEALKNLNELKKKRQSKQKKSVES